MYINMATLKPVNELQYKLCDATHRITETVDACRAPQYTVGRMSSAVQCDPYHICDVRMQGLWMYLARGR
jgi:hypothetical protein